MASISICGLLSFLFLSPYLIFPTCGNNLGSYPDMPLENLKNSAIFKVITDAVFEEVDMVPIKKADFFFPEIFR